MIDILMCAACIQGIYGLTVRGGFLSWLPTTVWSKPFYSCPKCMASIWGTAYWLYFAPELHYILFIFAVSGVGEILRRISYSDEPSQDEAKKPISPEAAYTPTLGTI